MTRLILTFETLFQVLAAEKLLKDRFKCRTTPTPAGLTTSICGISLELLEPSRKEEALQNLEQENLNPIGMHEV